MCRRWLPFACCVAFCFLVALNAAGVDSPAVNEPVEGVDNDALSKTRRDFEARQRFAPMWQIVSKYRLSPAEREAEVPTAAYANIWNEGWQKEFGITAEQKQSLAAIREEATTAARNRSEWMKNLSPEERQAEVKSWGGKSAPWRTELDQKIRRQIETVLTPDQLQVLRDESLPASYVQLLYNADIRRRIDMSADQETHFQQTVAEKLSRNQEAQLAQADKVWDLLSPEQRTAMPELVKRQGPTSAVLSIAYHVGFDMNALSQPYPLLAEKPVRSRLKLSSEQESQLQTAMANAAADRRKELDQGHDSGRDAENRAQIEAVLTSEQLALLKEIEFRQKVNLAIHYPEKRQSIGMTDEQNSELQRIDKETHDEEYRIDCEMLAKAIQILTPQQREQLRTEIEQRFGG